MKRTALIGLIVLMIALQSLAVSAAGTGSKRPEPPSSWAQVDVSTAIHTALVPSAMQSQYRQNTTRAEFCALAVTLYEKAMGAEIGAEAIAHAAFDDTNDVNVRKMAVVNVVSGVGDGKFDPDGKLTREQAATVLAQLAAALDKDFPAQMPAFADNAAIAAWAQGAVGQVQAAGIMGGVGSNTFSPKSAYTREQSIVTMLYLFHWVMPAAQGQLYPMSAMVNGQCLWGYADKNGAFVMQPQYAYASAWNGEYGIVSDPSEPEKCFVIDRTETPVVFAYGDRETKESFSLAFEDGLPSVFFAGNCVVAETESHVGTGEYPLYSLTGRKEVGSILFDVFSDGMICGRTARFDMAWACDADGQNPITGYGRFGAFYEGVAISWGRLYNKQGEVVSDVNLMAGEDILTAGFGENTAVGDSCIFAPSEWSEDGALTPLRGVIRADGTVILPAEYTYARLTECKQILTGKPGETYRLHDADGNVMYTFPTYMTGALTYNGNGYYMYEETDGHVVVLTTEGVVTAKIPAAAGARHEFVSGVIRVTEANGLCTYYTVSGTPVFEAQQHSN